MIDAVIFDCDGVLADSEALSIVGERAALAELGLDMSAPDYVARYCGMHDRLFFARLAEDFLAATGAPPPADFEGRVLAGRRREAHRLRAVAGAQEAMRAARAVIGELAVASSSRAHLLEAKLKRLDLFDLAAPHVYSADLVERGKPAPDVFLYAADRLGVAPGRCLVVEDSENGVRAGVAAGMATWGFVGGGHCFDGHGGRLLAAGAARVVDDHRALAAAFGELVG
ncbi:MAG: HAD family hydrolase [Parvularculaceae bacterium]